jgi:hypothetical protein
MYCALLIAITVFLVFYLWYVPNHKRQGLRWRCEIRFRELHVAVLENVRIEVDKTRFPVVVVAVKSVNRELRNNLTV